MMKINSKPAVKEFAADHLAKGIAELRWVTSSRSGQTHALSPTTSYHNSGPYSVDMAVFLGHPWASSIKVSDARKVTYHTCGLLTKLFGRMSRQLQRISTLIKI